MSNFYGYGIGYGIEALEEDEKDSKKVVSTDGDTDAAALEAFNSEVSLEYFDTFTKLQESNADAKIKMLKKLSISLNGCKSTEYYKSIENFINEESLESAAKSEASGGKHEANGSKVNKPELNKQKESFFKKVWTAIIDAIKAIIGFISRKISDFVAWIKKLWAQNHVSDLNDLNNDEYDALAAAIGKFEFEDQSEDGAVPIFNKAGDKFLERSNTYYNLCKHIDSMMNQMVSTGLKPEGFTTNINGILESLREIPGISDIPKIDSASKENIEMFNRKFKTAVSNLNYKHDPVGYVKYYTGQTLIQNKEKLTFKEYFNTYEPSDIISICNATISGLEKANQNIKASETIVEHINKVFNDFLNKNKYTNSNGDVTVADNIAEDKKAEADLNYQFIGSCLTLVKIIQSLSSIMTAVSLRLMDSAKNGTKSLLQMKKRAIDAVEKNHKFLGGVKTKNAKNEFNETVDKFDKSLVESSGIKKYDTGKKTKEKPNKESSKEKPNKESSKEKTNKDSTKEKARNDEYNKNLRDWANDKEKEKARKRNEEREKYVDEYEKSRKGNAIKRDTSFDNSGSQAWENWEGVLLT